ncbi:MAG: M3 family oligoendopeptidase [Acetatifactor sp.]
MKFCDMPYQRLTLEEIKAAYQEMEQLAENAEGEADLKKIMERNQRLSDDMTAIEICYIRHRMNVNDEFYAGEQNYYDEIAPEISELKNHFIDKLLTSPVAGDYKKLIGSQAAAMLDCDRKGMNSSVISLMQEESSLTEQYMKLTSNATVLWEGKKVNRALMSQYVQSTDRETRRKATLAIADSWEEQRAEIEEIYDRLVKNRDSQARALGYENFVDLSYVRMYRIGYDKRQVERFREEAKRELVPVYVRMQEEKRKRLKLEHLYSYDNGINFLEGNPVPVGDTEACMEYARQVFTKLSPETAEFIGKFMEDELYDVAMRDGKAGGGFMTMLPRYKMPFIFANFDGTSENAYVMAHEGGHAFQGYLKRNEEIGERAQITSEVAESHAMAMEFFVLPYMDLYFGERAEDYVTMHLEGAVNRILYQCEQDEFQQVIYENPGMSKEERNQLWKKLEKDYFPGRDHGENEYLREGRAWQRIPHTFYWPFYAIDYGLAQVIALEYRQMMKKDFQAAWQSYLWFCTNSGLFSFPDLAKGAKLKSPFEEGALHGLFD